MRAPKRILVAIKDPTQKPLPALGKAAQLARAFGAQVELFHGLSEPVVADAYTHIEGGIVRHERDAKAQFVEQLEALAQPLRKEGIDVHVSADWDFPPHEAIVRRARRVHADLIVAECHTGHRLAPWLLHLTDWELLRTSPVPVLLVKSTTAWRAPGVLAAIDPTHAFAKTAALDRAILDAASRLTRGLHGALHVMHSYDPVPLNGVPIGATNGEVVAQIAAASQMRARKMLGHALRKLRVPQDHRHLVEGLPFEAIPRTARKLGSRLVVMGAVSRSGLKRIFIGNTAERILNHLSCDVLVVKPRRAGTHVSPRRRGVHYVGMPQMQVPY